MSTVWEKSFAAFAGPGIDYPSETVRLGNEEAARLLIKVQTLTWQTPSWTGGGRHLGYHICNASQACSTALFAGEKIVGFYHGSYLWLASAQRGTGLSTPLILVAAEQRDGSSMPPGVMYQGYTLTSLAAHRAAYCHAVLTALAEGLPVPANVLAALRSTGQTA